jgi:HK97 family phage portal protein
MATVPDMRFLGLQITRAAPRRSTAQNLSPVNTPGGGGWFPLFIREPFSGAWQKNRELAPETILAYHAVYACITLISADVGKLGIMLMREDEDGIWEATQSPAFSPVLRKPNRYQTHIQFVENWIMSKLTRGNTYVLKERDERGVVVALYVLDPLRVTPLVADDGGVYYSLKCDNLAGVPEGDDVTVPASEIIHDRMNCLFHPLVGTSPLYACALAARQGLAIENNSVGFFENGAQPGGILIAPGAISDATAQRLKDKWEENFSGPNRGRLAVLGDGLKYEALAMTASDSQLIEQAKFDAEIVCSVFHVPPYMIGLGSPPTYQNVEALAQFYYSNCLQSLIESLEVCLDQGLALPPRFRTELDLDNLLRMDSATMIKTLSEGVGGGIYSPNEARKRLNAKPVQGGQTPYLQQQNYSLAALDERDRNNPFPQSNPAPAPATDPDVVPADEVQNAFDEFGDAAMAEPEGA